MENKGKQETVEQEESAKKVDNKYDWKQKKARVPLLSDMEIDKLPVKTQLKITLSTLKFDETINAEEFMTLSQYIPELVDNFTKTTDGAYKLSEGVDEVNNAFILMSQLTDEAGNNLFSGFEIAISDNIFLFSSIPEDFNLSNVLLTIKFPVST